MEWSQPKEQTVESIFVLQEASTPEGACPEHLDIHYKISPKSDTMTSQPKQLVPTHLQSHKPTNTVTTHVKKKVEEIIQRDTKYSMFELLIILCHASYENAISNNQIFESPTY